MRHAACDSCDLLTELHNQAGSWLCAECSATRPSDPWLLALSYAKVSTKAARRYATVDAATLKARGVAQGPFTGTYYRALTRDTRKDEKEGPLGDTPKAS